MTSSDEKSPTLSHRQTLDKTLWAVGGGKGGTGKSFIAANSRDSLAHYSLLFDRERWYILKKIEEACQNLNDPEKRKLQNLNMRLKSPDNESRTKYRKSTQKLEIEDAEEKKSLWKRIKFFLFSPKQR